MRAEAGKRRLFIATFLAPVLLLYGIFVGIPVFQAIQFSFYRWRGISTNVTFVGGENYKRLFADTVFTGALGHNMLILGVGGLFTMTLSLLVAHGIQGSGRLARFLRSIYLLPHIVPLIAVSILWLFLYDPGIGPIPVALEAMGIKETALLGQRSTALLSVGISFVWYALGFYVMLFGAGIGSISREVHEASELDGAEGWRKFSHVTWPLLWSIRRIAILNYAIGAMNIFAMVLLLTNGGNPDRATETMLTYLYEMAFENSEFGYGTAIAVVNLGIVMAIVAVVLFLTRRDPTEGRRS